MARGSRSAPRSVRIIGHLIPAGTGIYRYHDIEIEPPEGFQPPPPLEAPAPGAAPSPFVEEVEAE